MNWTHLAVLVVALLVGVVFSGTLRGLPGVSSLPSIEMRLAAAIWVGLFLGLILVEIMDYVLDTERRISDLERAVVAALPDTGGEDG